MAEGEKESVQEIPGQPTKGDPRFFWRGGCNDQTGFGISLVRIKSKKKVTARIGNVSSPPPGDVT
jgi:hypothetical protein